VNCKRDRSLSLATYLEWPSARGRYQAYRANMGPVSEAEIRRRRGVVDWAYGVSNERGKYLTEKPGKRCSLKKHAIT
jgi:hypothetical protein